MSNLAITYKNLADSATLTASPAADVSAPITYLQNDSRGHYFAAAAVGAQDIKGEWGGTAYTISCLRLDRTNLADGDTWRIQFYSDTAWTTGIYDSGTIAPFATDLYDNWSFSAAEKFFTPVASVKSFKITVTSAAVFHASRLYLGAYTTAEFNPLTDMISGWATNSTHARLGGGTLSSNVQSKWRKLTFEMLMTTEVNRAAWAEIGRYVGLDKSVWVSVFPNAGGTQKRDHSIIGKFEHGAEAKWAGYSQYNFSLSLNEV